MEGRLMIGGGGGLGEMKRWKDHGGPAGKEIRAGKPLVRWNLGFTSKSYASLMCVHKRLCQSPCSFPLGTRHGTLPGLFLRYVNMTTHYTHLFLRETEIQRTPALLALSCVLFRPRSLFPGLRCLALLPTSISFLFLVDGC